MALDMASRTERPFHGSDDYANGDWPRPRRRFLTLGRALGLLALLAAFGAAGFVAVTAYREQPADVISVDVPLITASTEPIKVRPEDPGGMAVPDQDKTIYEMLEGGDDTPVIERLLPPPEEPMARPTPPAAEEPAEEPDSAPVETAEAGDQAAEPSLPADVAEAESGPGAVTDTAGEDGEALPSETPEGPAPEAVAETAEAPARQTAAPSDGESAVPEAPAGPGEGEATTVAGAAQGPAQAGGTTGLERFAAQLAAFRTEEGANSEWERLTGLYPDLLAGYRKRIDRADLGEKGIYFRLRVPVASQEAAGALCQALEDRNQRCMVVEL